MVYRQEHKMPKKNFYKTHTNKKKCRFSKVGKIYENLAAKNLRMGVVEMPK